MPRFAARWETTSPSHGRSLMVSRSVAGTRYCTPGDGGPDGPSSWRKARIAMRASADSEMPAACASIATRAFSPADGRTVIEAGVVPEARLMTDGLLPSWSRSCARPQQAKPSSYSPFCTVLALDSASLETARASPKCLVRVSAHLGPILHFLSVLIGPLDSQYSN